MYTYIWFVCFFKVEDFFSFLYPLNSDTCPFAIISRTNDFVLKKKGGGRQWFSWYMYKFSTHLPLSVNFAGVFSLKFPFQHCESWPHCSEYPQALVLTPVYFSIQVSKLMGQKQGPVIISLEKHNRFSYLYHFVKSSSNPKYPRQSSLIYLK
jgi:hypothetical protein